MLLVDSGLLSLLDDFLGMALVLVVLRALGEAVVTGGVDVRYVGLGIVVVAEFGEGLGALDGLVALDDGVGDDGVEVLRPVCLSHELGGGWRFSHIRI